MHNVILLWCLCKFTITNQNSFLLIFCDSQVKEESKQ